MDCPNNRVWAENNVTQKAVYVHDRYQHIAVLVYTGEGIKARYPNQSFWNHFDRKFGIGSVLKSIDDDPLYGLKTPVFVFGFSKMRRGISFRSGQRVPTHFVLQLGQGHDE